MKSIGTKFSLAVGGLALIFSGIILYRAWSTTKAHTDELTSRQAELALEFDLAIRQYAAEAIRPAMEKRVGKDEFVIEAMSTSYIARSVFDKVHQTFPDYVIKFSSEHPHNPVNLAGPEEMKLLRYFQDNPQESRWIGKLAMNGNEYLAHLCAMRIAPSCLRCHGQPEDSPKSLLERYGAKGGFHYKVGDVAGMDMIAIPMDSVNAALRASATKNILAMAICLLLLLAAILVAFRYLVARRLAAITTHFQNAAQSGGGEVATVAVQGNDEISVLARSFNTLATRLQELYHSLEQRVQQRTAEVRREQQTLRHLLRSSDHERQMIAYEIHDGLAQDLAAAIMQFETHAYLREQDNNPSEAAKAYAAGLMLIRQSHAEARRLISGVRPPILDEAGVVAAIEHLVNDGRGAAAGVEIEYHHDVTFDRLASVLENAIYRIVQEGLTNAMRYSQSKKVRVELVQAGEELRVVIQDWGVGFSEEERDECFGLKGIRERARMLGGTAIIETAPGSGTRIVVKLPVMLRTDNG